MAATMPHKAKRTKGCDMATSDIEILLSSHVNHDAIAPCKLFKYDSKNRWQCIKSWASLINAILDATSGRIPKQKRWHNQLRKWLQDRSFVWVLGDTERAAYGLRQMMQALLKRKQNEGVPPHRYAPLAYLVDKTHASDADEEVDQTHEEAGEEDEGSDDGSDDIGDAVVEVPVKQDPMACVVLSDEEEAPLLNLRGWDLLEQNLFEPIAMAETPPAKKRRFACKTTPEKSELKTTPEKSELDIGAIVAHSLESVDTAPLPGDYKKAFVKKKPAAAKRMKKRPAAPAAGAPALDMKGIDLDGIVDNYVRMRGGSAGDKVLRHRLHSKLWHLARSIDGAVFAGLVAAEGKRRWLRATTIVE